MANHKSAIKRHRQSEKKRLRNRQAKSSLYSQMKKANIEINTNSSKNINLRLAIKALATAGQKGIIKKKTASRKISRLTIKANKKIKSIS